MVKKQKKVIDKSSSEYKIALRIVVVSACVFGAVVILLLYKLIEWIIKL